MTRSATFSIPEGPPRRGTARSRKAARWLLGLFGWRVVGSYPAVPRSVLIGAPHTSNWDFPVAMMAMFATGLRVNWLGKHSLFVFPVGALLRWFGGTPIDRRTSSGTVEQAIARFQSSERYIFGVAPEGTRRPVEQWKRGFWHIANGAGVPIVPIVIDWSRREVAITQEFRPSGDPERDIALLRQRYRSSMARRPAAYLEGLQLQ